MLAFFIAVEGSWLSTWMREDPYAYFVALIFHALGMALLVGAGLAIGFRRLGVGRDAPIVGFRGFRPVMTVGAVLAIASGLLLLAAYPAKALTNPLFAVKFACLIAAAVLTRGEEARRGVAIAAVVLWFGGVAAGKLLLHTAKVLTVSP